jgi:transposase
MTRKVRKQLFITRSRKLKEQAAATGVSEADLIRDGIDSRLEKAAQDQRAWQEIVDETVAKLAGAWAQRENLDEEMREIRGRWNRRVRCGRHL